MLENLVDDRLILDAGDHPGLTATPWADQHIDVKYPFQTLRPSHSLAALFGRSAHDFSTGAALSAFGRCHFNTVFAVGCKYTVESGQVYSGLGYQRRQLGNEIQRLKDDVRSAIAVGRFELVADIPRGRQ